LWTVSAVYAFTDGWEQAEELAQKCHATLGELTRHKFPDGETLVTATPAEVRGGGTVALYRSLYDPDAKLIEVLLAADALRGAGAQKVILITPYLPYMRQDRAFKPGQAVSQTVLGKVLAAHFDGVVTVQPHLHRTRHLSSIFGTMPALNLPAGRAIAADLAGHISPRAIVVGPDEESEPLVQDVASRLSLAHFVAKKVRKGDKSVSLALPGDIKLAGDPVIIVDDIISSGGTIAALTRVLKDAGAGSITVYAVHTFCDAHALMGLHAGGVDKVKSISSIPNASNVISVVDIIASGLGVRS
jgi:ribose-phosphate pyrophosphokinase